MASSKFSVSSPAYKQPVICKPAPPPILPFYPPLLLPSLQAMAQWTDLDPLNPVDVLASFRLHLDPAGPTYSGAHAPPGYKIELTLTRLADVSYWHALLQIQWRTDPPEEKQYVSVYVNVAKPFDTGFFGDVVIPTTDFRKVRVVE